MCHNVQFIVETEIKKDKTILETAKKANCKIKAPCGKGKCGKCVVKVVEGKVSEPTKNERKFFSEEELAAGYRLACETSIEGEAKILLDKE